MTTTTRRPQFIRVEAYFDTGFWMLSERTGCVWRNHRNVYQNWEAAMEAADRLIRERYLRSLGAIIDQYPAEREGLPW